MIWHVIFAREFAELKIDYTRSTLKLFLFSIGNALFYLNIRKLENIDFNWILGLFKIKEQYLILFKIKVATIHISNINVIYMLKELS